MKLIRAFIYSAGALLLVTALGKLFSGAGDARILQTSDPILGIPFGHVLTAAGAAELIVATLCFSGRLASAQVGLVAWLATSFALYRFGLFWMGYHRPCSCLGSLTDALGISPAAADNVMKIVLAYLLIGSYSALWFLWKSARQTVETQVVRESAEIVR